MNISLLMLKSSSVFHLIINEGKEKKVEVNKYKMTLFLSLLYKILERYSYLYHLIIAIYSINKLNPLII